MIITDALTDSSLFRRLDTLERQVAGLTDLLAEEELAMKLLEDRITALESAITPPTIFSFAPTIRDATSVCTTLDNPETP